MGSEVKGIKQTETFYHPPRNLLLLGLEIQKSGPGGRKKIHGRFADFSLEITAKTLTRQGPSGKKSLGFSPALQRRNKSNNQKPRLCFQAFGRVSTLYGKQPHIKEEKEGPGYEANGK